MAAWRPELTTKQQVVAFYENNPLVIYRVFAGVKPDINALRWEYNGDNKNEGINELDMACEAILANPTNINSYTLQLVRSDKIVRTGEHKAAKKIEDAINIVFQLNFATSMQPNIGNYNEQKNSSLEILMQKQIEQQNTIISLLTAKIQGIEDDSEPMQEPKIGERLMQPLFQLLESPIIQNALAEKISGFFSGNKQPMGIAGMTVSENDRMINEAITILKLHTNNLGIDLMKLATIAKNDSNQFAMLLKILHQQN